MLLDFIKQNKSKCAIVYITMAFIFFFIILSTFLINNTNATKTFKLNIIDAKNDKLYGSFELSKNDTFSVSFIHSVNKTKVYDYYKFDDKKNIYVYKTTYSSFGAGMPTELDKGESMIYNDDGTMTIELPDKKIDTLTYYLSDIYDHILTINDTKEISLWSLCGKKKLIQITIT